jgi:hypothetical protein
MMKKRVASWFGLQAPSHVGHAHGEGDRKKQNRRSISGLSQLLSAKQEAQAAMPPSSKQDEEMPQASPRGPSRMVVLADKISANTQKLEAYMRANNLPDVGFGVDDPLDFPDLPEHMQNIRHEITYATKELESITRGPREGLRWQSWSVSVACSSDR